MTSRRSPAVRREEGSMSKAHQPGRRRLVGLLLAAPFARAARAAPAQTWPAHPLRLLVPAGPGSVPDVRARWLADRLAPALGQPIVVENRPGAGGTLAMQAAARSAPDGYTVVMTHVGLMVFGPLLYHDLGYDAARDFAMVTRVGVGPLLLLVNAASPFSTLHDLLEDARHRPLAQTFASQGIGTPPHLGAELLMQEARIQAVHAPYTNPVQPIADLLAGQVDWLLEGTPVALPLVRGRRLRALAVTSPQRLPELPDVPTTAEAGLPAVVCDGWTGLAVPAATPPEVVERLFRETARLLGSEEAGAWFGAVGNRPGGETPAELARLVQAEQVRWRAVITAAHVQVPR
jgi:tripartite-type tricarboxylate transporter receptor subunit TctC